METDFPVIEVRQLEEEPVVRRNSMEPNMDHNMEPKVNHIMEPNVDHNMEPNVEDGIDNNIRETTRVYQAMAVRVEEVEEEEEDDFQDEDIPDEWKQSSVDTPTPPPTVQVCELDQV